MLRNRCTINTNIAEDVFVGISCIDNDIRISFPLGFPKMENAEDDELRHNILLLLDVLRNNTDKMESANILDAKKADIGKIPLAAYLYIVKDFLQNGYYKECVVEYASSKRGKINWGRTIKNKKPYVQDTDIFYLDFIIKKTTINENDLITLIHQYCVYQSFKVIGWVFTEYMPPRPELPFNREWFAATMSRKLASTFNDSKKELFSNMLDVINETTDKSIDSNSFQYGTSSFHVVWERMIDKVFGIVDKADYFPCTRWQAITKQREWKEAENSALMPDTIMITNGNVYVLDAKYYKYGWTGRLGDLPQSESINKQITYGEYIDANRKKFCKDGLKEDMKIYNAFIMPFEAKEWDADKLLYIGEATSDWKISQEPNKEYEHIKGFLLDVKYLMENCSAKNMQDIDELAKQIEKSFE